MIIMFQYRFIICKKYTSPEVEGRILIMGESVCEGARIYGTSLYFLLNFAVNLKLFKKLIYEKMETSIYAFQI